MTESNTTPPPQQGLSARNAFKIGCMATLGVFAACFLTFCALPAACTMGTLGSIAAIDEVSTNQTTTATDQRIAVSAPEAVVSTPSSTPAITPYPTKTPDYNKPIIGSTKQEILARFTEATRDYGYETNVDPQALKLVTDPILIIVYFNNANVAEGVSFLSNSGYMGNPVDGSGSYVHQNYQMLLNVATRGAQFPVRANVSTRFPVEIYIGNTHDDV